MRSSSNTSSRSSSCGTPRISTSISISKNKISDIGINIISSISISSIGSIGRIKYVCITICINIFLNINVNSNILISASILSNISINISIS